MNYEIKGINADEIRFKLNPVQTNLTAGQEKPVFQRVVRRSTASQNQMAINLISKVESTKEAPKFFDLYVSFVGYFEVFNAQTQKDYDDFIEQATREVYHYVRNAIVSLTSSANVFSVILPVNPPYFTQVNPQNA